MYAVRSTIQKGINTIQPVCNSKIPTVKNLAIKKNSYNNRVTVLTISVSGRLSVSANLPTSLPTNVGVILIKLIAPHVENSSVTIIKTFLGQIGLSHIKTMCINGFLSCSDLHLLHPQNKIGFKLFPKSRRHRKNKSW